MNGSTEKGMEKVIKLGATFGGVSSPIWNLQGIDAFQLNGIAKAAFSVAKVTLEVRAHY